MRWRERALSLVAAVAVALLGVGVGGHAIPVGAQDGATGASLTGTILDARGSPVAGAIPQVGILSADGSLTWVMGDPSTETGEYRLSVAGRSLGVSVNYVADETHQSSVLFAGAELPPGETTLDVRLPTLFLMEGACGPDACALAIAGHGFDPGIQVSLLTQASGERPIELAALRATEDGWIAADVRLDAAPVHAADTFDLSAAALRPGTAVAPLPLSAQFVFTRAAIRLKGSFPPQA